MYPVIFKKPIQYVLVHNYYKRYTVYVLAKLHPNIRLLYHNSIIQYKYIFFIILLVVTPLFPKLYILFPYAYMQVLYRYTKVTLYIPLNYTVLSGL